MAEYTIKNSSGDVLLVNTMPEAEYMYGCTPTAVGMILGYYDLYGYKGTDFSTLIDGVVEPKSRGTDGNAYNMDAFDTVLGRAIASEEYVYRFYSSGDIDVITGKKAGTYLTTSVEEELEYSFVNGGEGPEMRTDIWNCIADYLGTGQIWRGNENLSTSISQSTLEEILNYEMNINYIINGIERLVDWRYTSMLYGLYLYVEDKGYTLDRKITGNYVVDVDGGEFTFEDYKAEIDAGRPVLISIEGHSMVGYGYNDTTQEIIFDDCYQADQRMTWGGTYHYSDMDLPLQSITVIGLMEKTDLDLAVGAVSSESGEYFFAADSVPFASGDYCYSGSSVCLSFTVSNLGATAVGAFEVSVYVDGALTKTISVLSLEGNSFEDHTDIQLGAPAPGLHTVRVVADEANEIQEMSGMNNVLQQKLMVLKDGANIVTGLKTVNGGQVSQDDYVASGCQLHVLSDATASGTVVRGIVTDVAPNGVISYVPALAVVSQGGLIQDAAVYEYGQIQLGGTAEDLHVFEDGIVIVSSGGKLTGKLTVENGATVSMDGDAVVNFDLTKTEAGANALVNDLSRVQGTPLYTLTVSSTEANGIYTLATGATGFAGTITVQNTSGETLGTLTIGQTLTVGGTSVTISDIEYALILSGSVLSVAVSVPLGVTSSGLILTNETRTVNPGEVYQDTTVNSGGILRVDTDGTAEKTTVNEGGEFYVSPGGTADITTVSSGGLFIVEEEGAATGITVDKGGELHVAFGGTANEVTVNPGGFLSVEDGGTAVQIMENGGYVSVADGAVVTFAPNTISELVLQNASATIHSGTTAVSTTVFSHGWFYVSNGGTATGTTLNHSGSLYLFSGGTANDTIIGSGGRLTVSSGGTVDSTTVNYSGTLIISSGGTANDTIIGSGGSLYISSGCTAISTTVNPSGRMYITSGGTATGIVWTPCEGHVFVYNGGVATFVSEYSGIYYGSANQLLSQATVMDGMTIGPSCEMNVMSGGTVTNTTVDSNGIIYVSSGGTATKIKENGGYVYIENGADVSFASNTISGLELPSASATIHSGTTAFITTINSRGALFIFSGGSVSNTTVNSGGRLVVSSGGVANSTKVNSGGSLTVLSGGIAKDITIVGRFNNIIGGKLTGRVIAACPRISVNSSTILDFDLTQVLPGEAARYNDLSVFFGRPTYTLSLSDEQAEGIYVLAEGAHNFNQSITVVNQVGDDLGTLTVGGSIEIAGMGYSLMLSDNGQLSLKVGEKVSPSPYTSNGLVVNNSVANIESGEVFHDTFVYSGSLYVNDHGTADITTVEDGIMFVSGGMANSTTVCAAPDKNPARLHIFSGGTANSTTVICHGDLIVESDANVTNTTLTSGGRLNVYRGGTASITTVNCGGEMVIFTGGTANLVMENGGYVDRKNLSVEDEKYPITFVPNSFSGVVVNFSATVHSGTTANSTTINGGTLNVFSGGIANTTTVNKGPTDRYKGSFTVGSGGTANDTTVNSYGWFGLTGTANNTAVNSGGRFSIFSGTANSTTVNSSGSMWFFRGGIANCITVNSGGSMVISSGGTATGKMTFEAGAVVSMCGGAVLDFDLTQAEAGEAALVNDLSIIQGTPLYTLTVNDDLEAGNYEYTLAEGASKFNSTITVVNKAGDKLGVLTLGETVKIGYDDYTLSLNDSTLSVTVVASNLTPKNLIGTKDRVSWDSTGAAQYIVEYSTDHFEHAIQVVTTSSALDLLELPAGTYQWRVKADANSDWAVGETIVSETESGTPKAVRSNEDGNDDLFFAVPADVWEDNAYALHFGSVNDWSGTREFVNAGGKGRIRNLFFGSSDANILCLTDAENGDAIFVDDVYTDLPEGIEEHTARLYRIQEIRAGAGDDIVDMTSQRFEFVGDGLTIRGGDGDDTIWANKGDNFLFGDAGNDRIVGASGNDVIAGGIGKDRMHGGGGNDVFAFCDNWGIDTVEQLATGTVTLWFASGDESKWDSTSMTYTDGENSVKVTGVASVELRFGDDGSEQYATLSGMGAFLDFISERIFEETGKGVLASL